MSDARSHPRARMGHDRQWLARRLRAERERHGEDPIDVAYGIGVSLRSYERWEAGQVTPRLRSVRALAERWGIDIVELRPDLLERQGPVDRLERIEGTLDQVAGGVDRILTGLARAGLAELDAELGEQERRARGDEAPGDDVEPGRG